MTTAPGFGWDADESQDSGISCDSFNSSFGPDEPLRIQVDGPTDFSKMNISPDLPGSFFDGLDAVELSASHKLMSQAAKPRSPLKSILNTSMQLQESPVSRKSSFRVPLPRKRSRCFDLGYMEAGTSGLEKGAVVDENSFGGPTEPRKMHRAASTSQLDSFKLCGSPDSLPKRYRLDVVPDQKSSDFSFRRIESRTLATLLAEPDFEDRFCLVDCRYPFEYDAGHIKHAVNIFDPEELLQAFFPLAPDALKRAKKRIPIFYCEFSSVRGPNMANALREVDRRRNISRYPGVDYEEMYVLSQGYQHFYRYHNEFELCQPAGYVQMKNPRFSKQLSQYPFHLKSTAGSSCFTLRTRSSRVLSTRLHPSFKTTPSPPANRTQPPEAPLTHAGVDTGLAALFIAPDSPVMGMSSPSFS